MLARVVPQSMCRVPPAFVSSIVIVSSSAGAGAAVTVIGARPTSSPFG